MRACRVGLLSLLTLFGIQAVAHAQLATLLKDIRPTQWSAASDPVFLGSVDGLTYFSATAAGIGRELWTTDGTPEGTLLFDDRCPGTCGSVYIALGIANDHLFLARRTDYITGNIIELRAVGGNPPSALTVLQTSNGIYLQHLALPGWSTVLPDRFVAWVSATSGPWPLMATDGTSDTPTVALTLPDGASKSGLHRVGSRAYFWVYGVAARAELWSTDGTPAATHLETAFDISVGEPAVAVGNDRLVFLGGNGDRMELWGFDTSTRLARRLVAFPEGTERILRMEASDSYAFVMVDGTSGQELWATDGTPSGTRVVTSFGFPQPFGDSDLSITLHTAADRAYFFATDGVGPVRLWVSAGSPATTGALTDICDDTTCFEDSWIDSVDAQVFFLRESPDTGIEVWTTDGTAGGTRILLDACPGPCPGFGQVIASGDGRLTYGANDVASYRPVPFVATAPWTTATSLFDPVRDAPALDPNQLTSGIADGPIHYFGAYDTGQGIEPWVSRGTAGSSLLLADIAGPYDASSAPHGFAVSGDTVAFVAEAEDYRNNFWLTEGSQDSTRPAPTVEPTSLVFSTKIETLDDHFVALGSNGEIHSIDPVASTTETIQAPYCFNPLGSGAVDSIAVMVMACNESIQFWSTDGTAAGTSRRFDLPLDFNVRNAFRRVGSHLLMEGGTSTERLYALDATLSGLTPLTSLGVVPDSAVMPEGEGLAFFTEAERLWRTDGTPAGTGPLGTTHAQLLLLNAVRSPAGYDLLLQVDTFSFQIWTTDGTTLGTSVRASLSTPNGAVGLPVARVGGGLYFILARPDYEYELWVLDDGSSEPRRLHSASIAESGLSSAVLVPVPDGVLFSACDTSHGCELWRTDGTVDGTLLIQDIAPGLSSSFPHSFLAVGSTLYFNADDGLHGVELWTMALDGGPLCRATDQTLCLESGRFQVASSWRDFSGRSGDATAVAITSDTGYFWFFDEDNVELILKLIDGGGFNGHHWVFYGALSNVEYTFTVTDSETGAAKRYFNPATRFASSGDITAFGPQGAHAGGGPAEAMARAATPPEVSLAAFAAPQGLPGTCVPSPTRFCILNDRFAVTATWRDFAGQTGTANAGTLTDDTGYLWFFNEANVEVVLKMVDAGAFNQHFWVYYGALSNVEYTLTVTDTLAGGPPRIYRNSLGQFGSFGDIEAFPAP